jgi:hypothetical protein
MPGSIRARRKIYARNHFGLRPIFLAWNRFLTSKIDITLAHRFF